MHAPGSERRKRMLSWRTVQYGALLGGCLLLIVLARQNQELRAQSRLLANRIAQPVPGLVVPEFPAVTLDGDSVVIGASPPGEKQLLFVFTTTCPYCRAMIPMWTDLAKLVSDSARFGGTQAIGLSLDSNAVTREYVAQHRIRYPVAQLLEPRMVAMYRAHTVPATLLVRSDGRLTYARLGQFAAGPAMDSLLVVLGRDEQSVRGAVESPDDSESVSTR